MEITKIRIDEITPYDNNVKEHPREQIEQIKESISEFGNNDPIAIDENGVVIEGHGRLLALKELGYEEAECIRIEGLTEEQKNAYRLIHNKLTMNSGFDLEGLKIELEKIKTIDMQSFDFDFDQMQKDLEGMESKEAEEDDFDVDEAMEEEPIVKKGQIWKLGNHYLMCGDSTSREDVERLLSAGENNDEETRNT